MHVVQLIESGVHWCETPRHVIHAIIDTQNTNHVKIQLANFVYFHADLQTSNELLLLFPEMIKYASIAYNIKYGSFIYPLFMHAKCSNYAEVFVFTEIH